MANPLLEALRSLPDAERTSLSTHLQRQIFDGLHADEPSAVTSFRIEFKRIVDAPLVATDTNELVMAASLVSQGDWQPLIDGLHAEAAASPPPLRRVLMLAELLVMTTPTYERQLDAMAPLN